MPAGCGNWPALWTVGPNWPNSGEIDVVEGSNKQCSNHVALHTSKGCSMYESTLLFSGEWIKYHRTGEPSKDCHAYATPENYGCAINSRQEGSFGPIFNRNGGGYFIAELSDHSINVWFFTMDNVPDAIKHGEINPEEWPTPMAAFKMGPNCIYRDHFNDQVLVINNTFCGGYAGWPFLSDGCPDVPGDGPMEKCVTFVREYPDAFKESYWNIEYIRYYVSGDGLYGVPESKWIHAMTAHEV